MKTPEADAPDTGAPDTGAPGADATGDHASGDHASDQALARRLLLEERESIDNIDAALVHLLAERFRHTQRVGRLKAEHGLPPADPAREEQQVARLRSLARDAGLDPVFAEQFLRFIVTEVIRHHEQIRQDES